MIPDHELLRQYSEEDSQEAFTQVVHRYVDLVYSVALRLVGGDRHLAEDITQRTFIELARQAGPLAARSTPAGWLHLTTRNVAINDVRRERRRHALEKEVALMNETPTTPDVNWEQLQPVLDEAVARLNESDRDAVLLRFFQDKSHREIGEVLGLTENTARMRVERALEKLRHYFAQRGVTVSSALLAVAISTNSVQAAPVGLAASVAGASLTHAGAATLAGSLARIFTMTTKTKAVLAAVVVALAASIPITLQYREIGRLNEQLATLNIQAKGIALDRARDRQEIEQLRKQLAQLSPPSADSRAAATNANAAAGNLGKNLAALMQNPMMRDILSASAKEDAEQAFDSIIKHFALNPDERDEFLRLLTEQQVSLLDPEMKLLDSANLSSEDHAALIQQYKDIMTDSDAKIKVFLNNDDDFAYYQAYNNQKPERDQMGSYNTLLQQTGQSLDPMQADALFNLMYQERSNFKFAVDLSGAPGLADPQGLTPAAIAEYLTAEEQLQNQIAGKAADILTPAQLDAFKRSQAEKLQSDQANLSLTGKMLGVGN